MPGIVISSSGRMSSSVASTSKDTLASLVAQSLDTFQESVCSSFAVTTSPTLPLVSLPFRSAIKSWGRTTFVKLRTPSSNASALTFTVGFVLVTL